MITSAAKIIPKTEDFVRYEFKFPLDLRKREEVESEVANTTSMLWPRDRLSEVIAAAATRRCAKRERKAQPR